MTLQETFSAAKQAHQANRLDEAAALYRQVLGAEPNHPLALHQMGVLAVQQGRTAEGLEWLTRALAFRPTNALLHAQLGVAYRKLGAMPSAMAHTQQALQLDPQCGLAHSNMGILCQKKGDLPLAESHFRRAIDIEYKDLSNHLHLGQLLADAQRYDEAIGCFQRAVTVHPTHPETHFAIAGVYKKRGQRQQAESHLRQAVQGSPRDARIVTSLGSVLADLGRYEEALAQFETARALAPNLDEVYTNLGYALERMGRVDESVAALEHALSLNPASAASHMNLAVALLSRGDLKRGFAEHEWRLNSGHVRPVQPRWPLWGGAPDAGETIVLIAEQGFGDTFQFVRYASLLKQRGWKRVLVECPRALHPLLSRARDVDGLTARDMPPVESDRSAPLLSLPHLCETNVETIPADVPYISAHPRLVERWREQLVAHPGFRVGIAWQGNPNCPGDPVRSVPLLAFAPLSRVPGVRLINLQKGFGYEQLATVARTWDIVDFGDSFDTASGAFMDTAGVIANLDLVITSDTAIAHLAGAMGVPVWVLLSHVPDWRWSLDRHRSPWYPTMRLFLQPQWGDWPHAIQFAAHELAQLSRGKPAQ